MHETYLTNEKWAFECRRCSHHWSVAYEVHHTEGFDGGELCRWSRNGLPSMAPEAGMPCPRCNEGLRVTRSRPNAPTARRGMDPLDPS